MTEVQEARARMSEAIAQAYPGKPQWFSIFIDNLVYRPLFGKSAKQLKAIYDLSRKASLCATLPDKALQEMVRIIVFITEQLHKGKKYEEIKELVLSEMVIEPLVLDLVPTPSKPSGRRRQKRLRGRTRPMPGQLCLPGLEANAEE